MALHFNKYASVEASWPADVTAHFGADIYQGMNCLAAWKVIPVNALVGILDIIRNKVLNFVLEIESENPEAGDAPLNSQPMAEEKVQQIFHTHISGNVQNFATGSTNVKQNAVNNEQNEIFNQLLQALMAFDDNEESKSKLMGTVEEMRDTQGSSGFKNSYHKFMGVLADHIQVYGPVVAPFLPSLAAIVA